MITIIGHPASELRTFSHLSFDSFLLVMKEKDIPSRAGALQKGDLSTALEMTEGGNK